MGQFSEESQQVASVHVAKDGVAFVPKRHDLPLKASDGGPISSCLMIVP